MIFDQDKTVVLYGKRVGFVCGYFLFTTFLYFLLYFLNKLLLGWNYIHIMGITFVLLFMGIYLSRLLK